MTVLRRDMVVDMRYQPEECSNGHQHQNQHYGIETLVLLVTESHGIAFAKECTRQPPRSR